MNEIHPTAKIGKGVILGLNNKIGADVVISGFKDTDCEISIGDNNIIHPKTRILVDKFSLGNNNVLHNHVSIIGGCVKIGDDCWFGQYAYMDGRGGLLIGNRVGMGIGSYIWTHADYPALSRDCLLINTRKTIIEDEVWIVGCNVSVSPGSHMSYRTIALPNCVIVGHTEPGCVYGGIPAKKLPIKGWKEIG